MPQREPRQADLILAHLRSHPEGITPIEALERFGCFRLAARISDIRDALGPEWAIDTINEKHDGGRHARYVLVRAAPPVLFPELEDAA